MIRFAVIADPHVHDCAWQPAGAALNGAIRSFAETADSTRIFNESIPAFRRALEQAVEEDTRLVLLVGDLTDDGQKPNIQHALALIDEFRSTHGLRVLATPGNHDLFALAGRPMVKGFLTETGATLRVDSADYPQAATLGTAEALGLMQGLGYQPEPQDLHWESPFGSDPSWAARQYEVFSVDGSASAFVIDASYLIEPIRGLWVLSLDTNVPVPRDGAADLNDPAAWIDPTSNGWPVVLRHRPHLLPWMQDVAARAKALGKHLISFSHYPVLDALGISPGERALLGNTTGLACRAPDLASAEAFAASGVGLHISGHLHVNTVTRYESAAGVAINIAAPSPVGFAPGMKIFEMGPEATEVRTLPLRDVPGHDLAYAAYRREAGQLGLPPPPAAFSQSHGAFLDAHLQIIVPERYMLREWPPELIAYVKAQSLAQLLADLGLPRDAGFDLSLMDLVIDWYRLRKGGETGADYIPAERLASYRDLVADLPTATPSGPQGQMLGLLRLMAEIFARLPDRDFRISTEGLRVSRL